MDNQRYELEKEIYINRALERKKPILQIEQKFDINKWLDYNIYVSN